VGASFAEDAGGAATGAAWVVLATPGGAVLVAGWAAAGGALAPGVAVPAGCVVLAVAGVGPEVAGWAAAGGAVLVVGWAVAGGGLAAGVAVPGPHPVGGGGFTLPGPHPVGGGGFIPGGRGFTSPVASRYMTGAWAASFPGVGA